MLKGNGSYGLCRVAWLKVVAPYQCGAQNVRIRLAGATGHNLLGASFVVTNMIGILKEKHKKRVQVPVDWLSIFEAFVRLHWVRFCVAHRCGFASPGHRFLLLPGRSEGSSLGRHLPNFFVIHLRIEDEDFFTATKFSGIHCRLVVNTIRFYSKFSSRDVLVRTRQVSELLHALPTVLPPPDRALNERPFLLLRWRKRYLETN